MSTSTSPIDEYDLPGKDSEPWRKKKSTRYHHRDLFNSAIRRGLEIVQGAGPDALTLRGLARDLGVSASALLYHFGSRAGLRNAVAAWVGRDLKDACKPKGPLYDTFDRLRDTAREWLNLVERSPNLFRAAMGEGWRPAGPGWWAPVLPYEAPQASARREATRLFERAEQHQRLRSEARVGRGDEGPRHEAGDGTAKGGLRAQPSTRSDEVASCVAAALNGLAYARIEGVSRDRIDRALEALFGAFHGAAASADQG